MSAVLLARVTAVGPWARGRWNDPVFWTEVIQVLKTVFAAVVAWVVAADVFGLPHPYLAPWSALLVVHATVYRTFSRGLKQVLATVLGVVLAWLSGNLLGLDPVALTVMLLLAMLIGSTSFLREEATTAATVALIVLTIGYSDEDRLLVWRLVDTAVGVGVGLVVNLLVWPPLLDRSAARAIDAIDDQVGELLQDIAARIPNAGDDVVIEWIERTDEIDEDINEAWALVRQASESGRYNPRRHAGDTRGPGELEGLLHLMEQSVAEIRSMARTLRHTITNVHEWEPVFRDRWIELLLETGNAIAEPDSARITQVREGLRDLTEQLSTEQLSALHWPEYGGLLMNLRNIVMSMDHVAALNPVTAPRIRRRRPSLRG